ncbi:hypothetical protein CRM22_006716 [Opisthorchis felineus]|uniref:Uncharacterized protein n=1 Tax=Opisthorchis felineus TaxID=147828 RepID=A0A4V3SE99_OPIFE|nr:hypothetical protein CRM22_006716 [Opisthorchis felineus]
MNARHCGHNFDSVKSLLSAAIPTSSALVLAGQLNPKPANMAVAAEASRSIVFIDLLRPKHNNRDNCPDRLTADGSIISSLGINRSLLAPSAEVTDNVHLFANPLGCNCGYGFLNHARSPD